MLHSYRWEVNNAVTYPLLWREYLSRPALIWQASRSSQGLFLTLWIRYVISRHLECMLLAY